MVTTKNMVNNIMLEEVVDDRMDPREMMRTNGRNAKKV